MSEQHIESPKHAQRKSVFKSLCFRMDFGPVETNEVHKKTLNDSVSTKNIECLPPSLWRQRNASIQWGAQQPTPRQPLHHRCDSALRQSQFVGQANNANLTVSTEGFDRFQVVLDSLGRHANRVLPSHAAEVTE
jgi:hypothetical protein